MDKLYIIDAAGYIYRSYFAIPEMTNTEGEATHALFGFVRSLTKLFRDFPTQHAIAVFDGPHNTKSREAISPNYKAHRAKTPADLPRQIERAHQFCELMGIPYLSVPNVEADDTIGSIALWAAEQENAQVYLCTSDKDLCQFVSDKIHVLNTFKNNLILDPAGVQETFGVPPHLIVDFLSITGDNSDNVPGMPGFGPKTASKLLMEMGSLEALLKHPEKVLTEKKQEIVRAGTEQALLSKRLVTIDTTVPFPHDPEFFRIQPPQVPALKDFYREMNFSSLLRELVNTEETPSKPTLQHVPVARAHVDDEIALENLLNILKQQKEICFRIYSNDIHPMRAQPVGIAFSLIEKGTWYVPFNGALEKKYGVEKLLLKFKDLFESKIKFSGHDLKPDLIILNNYGIAFPHIGFDTMVASYILDAHSRQHSLPHLILEHLGRGKKLLYSADTKPKDRLPISDIPVETFCTFCFEEIEEIAQLKQHLVKKIEERDLGKILFEIEIPLIPILAIMEQRGIFIDIPYLKKMSQEVGSLIAGYEQEIYNLAGESFNLNSPKQLSYILFEKLGINPPKRTATGLSTNAEVLEYLQEDYPIAGKIIEYRTVEKLRSTYLDALPEQVNPYTHRVHCTFNQSGTATGRLSSQDPNLQNIPVRSEIGKRIRTAFRPQQPGWSYLAADYSQIELRLLAHFSEDPYLIEAFAHREDIHARTAARVFDVPLNQVTPQQRHQAKAVNFGILYGQQAFGLSKELGIDVKSAAHFIEAYFNQFKRVKGFIEDCKQKARTTGKAVTLTGRERQIPEINSSNAVLRSLGERLAVNTPLQGSTADLIKLAMIRIDTLLREQGYHAFMLVQIHDELLLEVPDNELDAVKELAQKAMQGVWSLKVPLIVDISIGKNWEEC